MNNLLGPMINEDNHIRQVEEVRSYMDKQDDLLVKLRYLKIKGVERFEKANKSTSKNITKIQHLVIK